MYIESLLLFLYFLGHVLIVNLWFHVTIIQDGDNGLVAMLLFDKDLSTVINKSIYHLIGKVPKVVENIFPDNAYMVGYATHNSIFH